MFCCSIQLSVFVHVISLAEIGDCDNEVDILRLYEIHQIPWNSMRVLFKYSDIDYERQTGAYNKLVIDLLITHLVQMMKLKVSPSSDPGEVLEEAKVSIEYAGSNEIKDCTKRTDSEGSLEFSCMVLSRKIIIISKPRDTTIEVHGRETMIENYAGCYEYKGDLEKMFGGAVDDKTTTECAESCRRKRAKYFGFSSAERCCCANNLLRFLSIDLESCRGCSKNKLYFCGSKDIYFGLYKTEDVMEHNLQNPVAYDCLDDADMCGECPAGSKGYNCEFHDCSSDNGGCQNECAVVSLVNRSFEFCRCPIGFTGYEDCEDYDECTDMSICDEDQTCTNTVGSFECVGGCRDGYKLESGNCEDIDECMEENCDSMSTRCVNTPGSHECTCLLGFKESTSPTFCDDQDECLDPSSCGGDMNCTNTIGSFKCSCMSGFKMEHETCKDIDECEGGNCDRSSTECVNIPGSYECNCLSGFIKSSSPTSCEDYDECLNPSSCDEGKTCTNTAGSFQCGCLSGYKMEHETCEDIDECKTGNECDSSTSECINTDGSYDCKCFKGYETYSATSCQDIDECRNVEECDPNSTECVNLLGSFKCACLRGYYALKRNKCTDIDECVLPETKCPTGVPCVNFPGWYDCFCPEGTRKIEFFHVTECEDIDECIMTGICNETSSYCLNTIPSYICACRLGYISIDNFNCVSGDENYSENSTWPSSRNLSDEFDSIDRFHLSILFLALSVILVLSTFSCFYDTQATLMGSRRSSTSTSTVS